MVISSSKTRISNLVWWKGYRKIHLWIPKRNFVLLSDWVRLLKQGCMTLQSQFEQIVNFNSMENCITIASACNAAYRKKWMPEEKIAVEPIRGWRPAHNQSHIALHWLYWKEQELNNPKPTPRIAHVDKKNKLVQSTSSNDVYIMDVSNFSPAVPKDIPFT